MTYLELITALEARTGYRLLPTPDDTFLTEVTQMIYNWCALTSPQAKVERAAVVNSLGPLRREFMAGMGSAHDFRKLNQLIEAIDAEFDDAHNRQA
ncbi:hypothetical protein [Sulfuriferula nivalis]|uniref:Uncharacterized protein n=1 Tax=Sulfuriferula nivalis TaxID=2675298 RepID=A0A809SI87_9PROT|nr:hypothetical protein [Sulfuriferula nivalis]BBP01550.1 hypothetical protein SFSGTM_22580 [Sulfuriferula nivalis]